MRIATLSALAVAAAGLAACDVCAGTPSCTNPPEISAGGQFIERSEGAPVAGVRVEFVRLSGPELRADTIRSISDDDGFFQLRADALATGIVGGTLRVIPPAPRVAFEITNVALKVTTRRADGQFLGRLSVEPYLVLVGQLYDRYSGAIVPEATVIMRHAGGASMGVDSAIFTTDDDTDFDCFPNHPKFPSSPAPPRAAAGPRRDSAASCGSSGRASSP